MKLGIVGHGADKFTSLTKDLAFKHIESILFAYKPDSVCSGQSPVGGIDIWAEEIVRQKNIHFQPFPAEINTWEGNGKIGFKQRNLQIAAYSDIVICIVVRDYPPGYKGMVFKNCYHCDKHKPYPVHVKSGGCWTAWKCPKHTWVVI